MSSTDNIIDSMVDKIKSGQVEKYVFCVIKPNGASITVASKDVYGLRQRVNEALKKD